MAQMLRATLDNLIVAEVEAKEQTDSGLWLGKAEEQPLSVVVSVGPLCKGAMQPGDTIFWLRDMGTSFVWDGGWRLNIVPETEVLAVIEGGQQFDIVQRSAKL